MPHVVSLRRYPVKSMGGEALRTVEFDARGVVGDRWYAVRDAEGRLASGKNSRRFRRRDEVFDFTAATDDGRVYVTGTGSTWAAGDPELDAHLSAQMGESVTVAAEDDVPHQDSGSVSLIGTATLDWCLRQWCGEADPRRLRVNLVIETDEPFVEESWIGREASLGTAVLRPVRRIPRCRMIDIDQDGATVETKWLKRLTTERDMNLAVYADVVRPGRATVGDEVRAAGHRPGNADIATGFVCGSGMRVVP